MSTYNRPTWRREAAMAIWDLFSKRQKRLRGDVPDVYAYDVIPDNLRVQIVHIIRDGLGRIADHGRHTPVYNAYKMIVDGLCREYGYFVLPPTTRRNYDEADLELFNFILKENTVEYILDAIEVCGKVMENVATRWDYAQNEKSKKHISNCIEEINARLKEGGVGYFYSDGEIIRIDSQLLHKEVVIPSLILLSPPIFHGPDEEFRKAHEHYRHKRNKEALVECLKAFESMLKAVCTKRGWAFNANDTARPLINVCLQNGLIPTFWQTQYTSLASMLESSVPTGRNKLAGHGQGATPTTVPDYLVGYMLHMTASSLLFLAEAEKALP